MLLHVPIVTQSGSLEPTESVGAAVEFAHKSWNWVGSGSIASHERRRSELPTTSKLLTAIATAATAGVMTPNTARGTETRL